MYNRADSRVAPSQWDTALLCNDVSHWLDENLEPALSDEACDISQRWLKGLFLRSLLSWEICLWNFCCFKKPGGRLNIKMSSYQNRDTHVRDKMVLWPYYLWHGNPHISGKDGLYIETGPEFLYKKKDKVHLHGTFVPLYYRTIRRD